MTTIDTTKMCPKCKRDLAREAFTFDKRTPTGLKCYCRECATKDAQERRALVPKKPPKARKRKPVPQREMKTCPRCSRSLALDAFAKDAKRPDGKQCWCRECKSADAHQRWKSLTCEQREKRNAVDRAWRKANTDKTSAHTNNWRRKNPDAAKAVTNMRRARRKGAEGFYTAEDVARIFASQKGKCAYCRTSLKRSFHPDHIIPLAGGGSNWPRNIQLTCAPCNHRKHATDPIKFSQRLGRLL